MRSPAVPPTLSSTQRSRAEHAPAPRPGRFEEVLGRIARGRGEVLPAARRTPDDELPQGVGAPSPVAGPRPHAPEAALPVERVDAPDRAAAAIEAIALRDRSSVELRFERGLTVRVEALAPGVALSVERGASPLPATAEPAALAQAVRARGVPVVRADLRASPRGARQGRSGAR